jgi:6-phosphofructokinase
MLKPESVKQIHLLGGSILGNSRGEQEIGEMVDTLEDMKVDILFVVGGDGTLRGAERIAEEVKRRGLTKAIVGIPKTIDNDIQYLDKSFGFETAFGEAVMSVRSAHAEALGAPNGIGLVRLMGRESGFIACYAALADGNVDFVLIPEAPFKLDGERGLLEAVRYRVARKKSAVIVMAEGAGSDLMQGYEDVDASGNKRPKDIGIFLRDRITAFFRERRIELNLKYIDPSYIIRSVPANGRPFILPASRTACVHAAMAGKTGCWWGGGIARSASADFVRDAGGAAQGGHRRGSLAGGAGEHESAAEVVLRRFTLNAGRPISDGAGEEAGVDLNYRRRRVSSVAPPRRRASRWRLRHGGGADDVHFTVADVAVFLAGRKSRRMASTPVRVVAKMARTADEFRAGGLVVEDADGGNALLPTSE